MRNTSPWVHLIGVLYTTVENGVEFSWFVCVADFFEQVFDFVFWPQLREFSLCNSHVGVSSGEKNINRFGLISVILMVCYRLQLGHWNVSAHSRATKCSVFVLRSTHNVASTWSGGLTKVRVWSDFLF